jgi:ribose-phosphate pyrophosphokinase
MFRHLLDDVGLMEDNLMLFAGTSHEGLAKRIAAHLGVKLGLRQLSTFPDGEISLQILENVRGKDVFILQSIAREPNFYLMELLIIIDALKRASAKSIAPVIPYFGYSRQDRKDKPRVPITAKLVADLLQKAGATRVLTMDLHAGQIQGFFDIPVDNFHARLPLISAFKTLDLEDLVVVAPDVGSIKLARVFSRELHADLAVIDKRRVSATQVVSTTLIGDVKGKDVLLVDDMCSTGDTLVMAAEVCKAVGAKKVCAAVTHGLFVEGALEKLDKSLIEILLVADTVPANQTIGSCKKLKVITVSTAELFAEGIRCIESSKSVSSLTVD